MNWHDFKDTPAVLELIAGEAWERDRSLPRWYRDATKSWTATEADFRTFVSSCVSVYVLDMAAVVYIEEIAPADLNVHFSVLRPIESSWFIREAQALRDHLFRCGARNIRGWALQRNRALVKIMLAIGFRPSELVMDYGVSHGKVLRWQLMEMVKA